MELIATAKNNPVLFDATFDDKASAGRFQVDSFATGMEVLPSLLRAKKISSAEGYQLFLEADGGVRVPVGDNQCVLEAVAHMERIISATSKPRQQDIDVVMHCLTAVKLKPHGLGGNAVAPQETRKP